jgi:hypothetical protein
VRFPLLAVALLLVAAPAAAAASRPPGSLDARVRDCVQKNRIRYTTPDKALVAQYIDLASACRALLDRPRAAIVVTPLAPSQATPALPPATTAPSAQPAPRPRPSHSTAAPQAPAAPSATISSVVEVRATLAALHRERPQPLTAWWRGAARWLLGLVAFSALLVLAGAVLRTGRRTR